MTDTYRLEGRHVLVTGGTGSIGSEIVREVLRHDPAHVTVVARDDSKLFYLAQATPRDLVTSVMADVRDPPSLERVFERDVDVVFHAAAIKHVGISEENPLEPVLTNIIGTQNVVDAAVRGRVDRFVTVSTDKAVSPNSTMGATKYLAEKVTRAANARPGPTRFSCVRFGNVLASRGSVLPAFARAIRRGGVMRVSDPEVTRFAMSIPDAAALVVRAGRIARGGETFVLKMKAFRLGDVVDAFLDVADMKPPVDVVGLGAGEKLHEDLVLPEEAQRLLELDDLYVVLPETGEVDASAYPDAKPAALASYSSKDVERYDPAFLREAAARALAALED